tara:strand:- start:337 stop:849 length:513 start_codon:yes stop_codon:yes gene_type:complete
MKKVNIFKTSFQDGTTHYGISEQVHTIEAYLSKTISISHGQSKRTSTTGGASQFHKKLLINQLNVIVELISTYDTTELASIERNRLVSEDTTSMNSSSAINHLGRKLVPIKLPTNVSKSLTNRNGEKLYFLDVIYANKKQLLDIINIKVKHPMFSNMAQVNTHTYRVNRV